MKRLLLSLLFLLPLLASAQSNFQKGYVVTTSKDTINGFIDYKEREINPGSFNFRSEINGKSRVFTLENCTCCNVNCKPLKRFLSVNNISCTIL